MNNLPREKQELIERMKEAEERFVILSKYWPDSHQYCVLPTSDFIEILQGKESTVDGEDYTYDGMGFSTQWRFNGKDRWSDELEISYNRTFDERMDETNDEDEDLVDLNEGGDHEGMGYRGDILDCRIELSHSNQLE